MTESYIQIPPDGLGKKTRTSTTIIGGNEIHQQVFKITGSSDAIINPSTEETLVAILSKINIYVDNEIPSGTINDINVNFTTFYNYKPGTTKLFLNGLRQKEGVGNDYIEGGTNIFTFNIAPSIDDTIIIDYIKL